MRKVKISLSRIRIEELKVELHLVDRLKLRSLDGDMMTLAIDHRTVCLDRNREHIIGVSPGDLVNIVLQKKCKYIEGIQVIAQNGQEDAMCEYMVGRRSPISRQTERSP